MVSKSVSPLTTEDVFTSPRLTTSRPIASLRSQKTSEYECSVQKKRLPRIFPCKSGRYVSPRATGSSRSASARMLCMSSLVKSSIVMSPFIGSPLLSQPSNHTLEHCCRTVCKESVVSSSKPSLDKSCSGAMSRRLSNRALASYPKNRAIEYHLRSVLLEWSSMVSMANFERSLCG